jgi:hypothetical protein
LDWLGPHPHEIETAITTPRPRSGSLQFDCLVAAIAERVADDAEVSRPRWCASIPGLTSPWWPPGTPRMIERARRDSPPQFTQRYGWVAARDLWRDGA